MEELTSPGYYAVIPANVRYDDNLPANAKLLYGEISALVGKDGFCFASNSYFAELYQLTERTISKLISCLQDGKYIRLELERDAITKQILVRKIYLNLSTIDGQPVEEKFYTPRKNLREGIEENFQDINTSNTDIYKENKKESPPKKGKVHSTKTDYDPTPAFAFFACEVTVGLPKSLSNELYEALVRFAENRKAIRKPIPSQASVTALCNKLREYSQGHIGVMIELLDTATSSGWQTVYPSKSAQQSAVVQSKRERQYKCV